MICMVLISLKWGASLVYCLFVRLDCIRPFFFFFFGGGALLYLWEIAKNL